MRKFNNLSEHEFKVILTNAYQLGTNSDSLNSVSLIEEIKKQILTAMSMEVKR